MRFAYYLRNANQRTLATAVMVGARIHGDEVHVVQAGDSAALPHVDGLIFFGIGGDAKTVHDEYRAAGKRVILLDKGYTRRTHVKVSVDAFQPLAYFQRTPRPPDRWRSLGIVHSGYRMRASDAILLDGASNKYCLWNELGDWAEWGQATIDRIRANTPQPIIYRPRPSHNDMPVVKGQGVSASGGVLKEDFARSRVVVSHGGNIGFDAVVNGVAHFAIGDSIARPLSETDWRKVGVPRYPSAKEQYQWLCDVAYCQWTIDEFADGRAWRHVRGVIDDVGHTA